MALRDDRGSDDREILDFIPERFDNDPDSRYARKGAHTRLVLTIALAVLAIFALGAAARHIFFGEAPKPQSDGIPVIKADDHPIKTKPDDRGGMDVPNQDKLIYERMGSQSDAGAPAERLLPPPEQPQDPATQPRKPSIKPAFPTPPARDVPASAGKPGDAAATAPVPPPAAPGPAPAPAPTVQPPALSPAKPTTPAPKPAATAKAAAQQVASAAPVPAPAAQTPAAPAPAKAAGGSWLVQLGALKTEAEAKSEWNRVKGVNKDLLSAYGSDIVRVDLGEKGVFWRLRAGPMDEGQARSLCANLSKRSQGCIIAKK